jgi:hypothetical protein
MRAVGRNPHEKQNTAATRPFLRANLVEREIENIGKFLRRPAAKNWLTYDLLVVRMVTVLLAIE